jgi:hypothetical protein
MFIVFIARSCAANFHMKSCRARGSIIVGWDFRSLECSAAEGAACGRPVGIRATGIVVITGGSLTLAAVARVVPAHPEMPVVVVMIAPPNLCDRTGGFDCSAKANGSAGRHRIGAGGQSAGREQRCHGGGSYEQLTHVNLLEGFETGHSRLKLRPS